MLSKPARYRIKVKGELSAQWIGRWGDLQLTTSGGNTILTGIVVDQTALHGHLTRIRDLGLPLLLVEQIRMEQIA